ncbi:MAG: AAA family ATPase [Methylobacter sp.]|nr:AAA family ATPase [Candidatus Methylobacter titanis]
MNAAIQLRKALNQKFPKQFELDIGEGGFVLLTIISNQFKKKTRKERLELVEPLIKELELTPGIIELYTSEEATNEGVSISNTEDAAPLSWQDAVGMLSAGKTSFAKKPKHSIKRVVFYSYKGGVGRTTALIQTAFQLTRQGKRVVLVDMDVEAPGLQALLPPIDKPVDEGLIDYLWERQTCFFDEHHQPKIELTNIIYSVKDSQSRRDLFIVPAGKIGQRYIQRLSILSTTHLFSANTDPWYQFEEELWKQYQPDIMLIDARTGLNEWGGLSLLQLADEAFVVLYPSQQNAEGICFVRNLLKELTGVQAKLVLSPIPVGEAGDFLVKKIKPFLNLIEDEEPISIYYDLNIAVSNQFPVEPALPYYAPLANQLLEISGVEDTATVLAESNRLELIKSLNFPERNAASILDTDFDAIFQKTADFDRCLEDQVWVIRGRKGTGKSTLYTLFTQHRENAEKRSRGRLDNVTIISGHGVSNSFKPNADVFSDIQKQITADDTDWLSLWRAYAVIRLYQSYPEFSEIIKKAKLTGLLSRLKNFSTTEYSAWESKHTAKLLEFVNDIELNGLCRDAITRLNSHLKTKNQKIWLLYDDLDQDIKENTSWQKEALGGLMRFIYDTNNNSLYQIRFKVFLREDIWSNLVFTNKSHFGDQRTLLLKWDEEDFFRLAYRLAIAGSDKFRNLANRIIPLPDNQLDECNIESLRQILSPLWGLRRQKTQNAYVSTWVYSRLTDSSENTYPRSLTILLSRAKEVELQQSQGKSVPTDHLLRWNSLTKGLEAASVERCDSIKNEYPELSEFFNNIGELGSLFSEKQLKDFWQKSTQLHAQFETFDAFLKRLKDIGMLQDKKYSKKYNYAIANIYIDGFNIRTMGQKK